MSVFLRILLSLALVLNGTSGAWAMERAVDAAPTVHAAHAMTADAAVPPCHERADRATPDQPPPAPTSDDCCQTTACQCACAQLAAAAFALNVELTEPAPGTAFEVREPRGHPAPPLPHQTRPPIV